MYFIMIVIFISPRRAAQDPDENVGNNNEDLLIDEEAYELREL